MLNTVLFLALLILFAAILIRDHLVVAKQEDTERLTQLIEQINIEKALKSQNQEELESVLQLSENTDRKFLKIKLELLSIEDDLQEILPGLLN
ncbi:hypothetical protein [Pseudotenacibaculum haliotis]|uniref:Uncharacterized protein n=1 Tax=Pseudotenacibaculum haliotis TaxID=1862138 RepID=A0ABW5LYU9_9FLAO